MKKLVPFLVLWIAFFPLFTSAQTPESELCQTCLEENEDYYSCVFEWDPELWFVSCQQDYDNAAMSCSEGMSMCEEWCNWLESEEEQWACFEQCTSDFEQCDSDISSVYDSCVAWCQSSYCWAWICSSAWWLAPWWDWSNTQWWWSQWWSQWWSSIISSNQISWMWTALVQWWSWLLHIAIQLMPYAIAFVVIIFVFYYIYHLITKIWWRENSRAWKDAERRYNREKAKSYDSWSDYDQDPFR